MPTNESVWDGIDRRRFPPIPSDNAEFWQYMATQFELTQAKLNALHMDMISNKADLQHLHNDVDALKKAFPKDEEGKRDIDGHRGFHEQVIDSSRTWREIWIDVRKKVFSGVAWSVLLFVAYSVWESIKHEAKK